MEKSEVNHTLLIIIHEYFCDCGLFQLNKPWQKKCYHNFSFSLDGQLLTQTNATKFLGVYIDEHLTWKNYINELFM